MLRWYRLKCSTRSASRDHMNTSCCESPKWSARQLPKLPAPNTRILLFSDGFSDMADMIRLVGILVETVRP